MKRVKKSTWRKESKVLNVGLAIDKLKIDALPSFIFNGSSDIIPYGIDNIYPHRIISALNKSSTAKGCVKRLREFIFGNNGFGKGGEIIVNRNNETLNQVLFQFIRNNYVQLSGGGLHLNFNASGLISEIFFVSIEHMRKCTNLKTAQYGLYDPKYCSRGFVNDFLEIDIYGKNDPVSRIREFGIDKYRGQLAFFNKDNDLYPDSDFEPVIVSAEYEFQSALYSYANMANGFSGMTIIKKPVLAADSKAVQVLEDKINNASGAVNAGSKIVLEVPIGDNGTIGTSNLVENISPPNVDSLSEKQDLKAQSNILKAAMMPGVLLGISETGMFNKESFNDAFDYKNADTEQDRELIETFFNSILDQSVFRTSELKIEPLSMKSEMYNEAKTMKENE